MLETASEISETLSSIAYKETAKARHVLNKHLFLSERYMIAYFSIFVNREILGIIKQKSQTISSEFKDHARKGV